MTDTTAGEGVNIEAELDGFNRRCDERLAAQPSAGAQGEVVAWGCFDQNGALDERLVYRDKRRAEDAAFAFTPSMTAKPLYTTPAQPDTGDVAGLREALAKALAERDGFTWTSEPVLMAGRGGLRSRVVFERLADDHLSVVEEAGLHLAALSKPNAQGRVG